MIIVCVTLHRPGNGYLCFGGTYFPNFQNTKEEVLLGYSLYRKHGGKQVKEDSRSGKSKPGIVKKKVGPVKSVGIVDL